MRLIDADELKIDHGMSNECDHCKQSWRECQYEYNYCKMDFCTWIDDAPTIEPQQKRGRWIEKEDSVLYWHECSVCGCKPLWNVWKTDREFSNFCPNCGAKMDGGEEDDEK